MNWFLIMSIVGAALGMFQYGYNIGCVNAPEEELKQFLNSSIIHRHNVQLSEKWIKTCFSAVVSIFVVGGMIGSLMGSFLANKFGRRQGLLYAQVLTILGASMMGFCKILKSYEMLLIGRFLVGVSSGIFTGISPLYIVEVSPIKIRGATGTINQLGVTMGMFCSMVLGIKSVLGGKEMWPVLFCFSIIPCLIQCILLAFMCETPRYLILSKKNIDKGRIALQKLNGNDDVESKVKALEREESEKAKECKTSVWSLICSSRLRLSLFVCICLQLSKAFCGMIALHYYSTSFFKGGGMTTETSQFGMLILYR